ncbi:MAG: Glucose-6-phosphate isomerase [candidate division CPR2 bacterium GW2011_GWD2_39_7]|nr:MAG: Glucose-6-phosphate isomerase [candidate division CPR2 bacterium GW2011_GWD2_39_7]
MLRPKWKKTIKRPINLVFEETSSDTNKLGAIGAIASFVKENNLTEELLVIGGDNYFKFDVQDFLSNYNGKTLIGAYDIGDLKEAKKFGVLSVKDNKVIEFQEKPKNPKSTLVNTLCCVFPTNIYPLLFDFVKIHTDNQGSFIEHLVKETDVEAYVTAEDWFDIGSFDGYMEAHKRAPKERNHDEVSKFYGVDFWGEGNVIKGNVFFDQGAAIKDSTIENCIIFSDCKIEDSVIKNCIIDEGAYINNAKITGQIIEKGSHITDVIMNKEKKIHLGRDLAKDSGLPIKIQGSDLYLGNKKLEYATRSLEDARPYLAKSKALCKIEELYRMFRDVYLQSDLEMLRKNNLRYDITIIAPGLIGDEYVKTIGHYHPLKEGAAVSYPEIYEVIEGHANFILQKAEDGKVEDFIVVQGQAGDKVIIPPDYGHVTINVGNTPLIMANVTADNFSSEYGDFKKLRGAAMYRTKEGWKANPRYEIENFKKAKPNLSFKYLDVDLPLYKSLINDHAMYDYLVNPEKYSFKDALEITSTIKIS